MHAQLVKGHVVIDQINLIEEDLCLEYTNERESEISTLMRTTPFMDMSKIMEKHDDTALVRSSVYIRYYCIYNTMPTTGTLMNYEVNTINDTQP